MSSPLTQVSELSVPVPWGEIRGKSWGPDGGYPVLCLHGWADNCGSFDGLIPLLPKECRFLAMDLAGHGFSSHRPPGVRYLLSEYVADVRRVVEGLGWTKFSVIGHSMGGNISAVFGALYPEMVDAIVLLDTYGFVVTRPDDLSKFMRQGMDEMIQFEEKTHYNSKIYTYEKAKERLLAANPALSERSVSTLLKRGLTGVEGGFVFSRDLRVNFKHIDRFSLELCLMMQSKLQASILIVLADNSSEAPHSEQRYSKLLQVYKDGNHAVATVPGDHHVHLNDPEVVAPLVTDFLQSKVISQQLPA
ncbi:unnamed protein product [Ophioblennius macclurei]